MGFAAWARGRGGTLLDGGAPGVVPRARAAETLRLPREPSQRPPLTDLHESTCGVGSHAGGSARSSVVCFVRAGQDICASDDVNCMRIIHCI
jgi:hypothetical protein